MLAGALLCAGFARPQASLAGKSLEELLETPIESVTGASRYRQRVTEAPSSVTVITADEIRRYGWRRLTDVLQSARGFHNTSDRLYNYVGVRGFARPGDYNSRILVLINGHRINENIYEGAYVEDGFPVDMDLVERIEIIRGPGSSLYGTNALFAVVNVQTKPGGAVRETEFSLEAASLRSKRMRITRGFDSRRFGQVLASMTAFSSAGQSSIAFPGLAGPLRNSDRESAGSGFVSWQRGHWTVEGAASLRRKFSPLRFEGQRIYDSNSYGNDTRGYLDASYRRDLGERTSVLGRVFYDRYLFDGRYPYEGGEDGAPVVSREFANGGWWGAELQVNHRAGAHQVTTGFEARLQPLVRLFTYDENPYYAYGGARTSLSNTGVFLQDEWTLHRKLHLTGGLRWDHYSTFGHTVNPRASLVYQPFQKTSLKLLYGQAFRAPNPYERTYETTAYRANPGLVPEKLKSTEVVWEQYWATHWRSSASFFRHDMRQVISQVDLPDGAAVQYQNEGRYTGWGGDAEIAYQQKDAWDLLFSYSQQRFRNQRDGAGLSNSPRHLAKVRLSRPLWRGRTMLGGELHYFSSRSTVSGERLPGYFWPSLTLSSRQQKVELSFSVYNALDALILHPIGGEYITQSMRQNGRGFRAQLRIHLDEAKLAGRAGVAK